MNNTNMRPSLRPVTAAVRGLVLAFAIGYPAIADAQLPQLSSRATDLESGLDHTCVLNDCGQAQCWGRDDFGQATPPARTTFTQLSLGLWHSCGIRTDNGRTECWGRQGLLTQPPSTRFVSIDAGMLHTCGLRADGGVECWGIDWNGSVFAAPSPRSGVNTVDLSAGVHLTCTLYDQEQYMQCEGGGVLNQPTPISLPYVNTAYGVPTQISAGQDFACYRVGENLNCFGDNTHGQASGLGADQRGPSWEAAAWADGAYSFGIIDYIDVSVGPDYGCALRKTGPGVGDVQCWGRGHNGPTKAALPAGDFVKVSAGRRHACALDEYGGVACWNWTNEDGQYDNQAASVPQIRCRYYAFPDPGLPELERVENPYRLPFGD